MNHLERAKTSVGKNHNNVVVLLRCGIHALIAIAEQLEKIADSQEQNDIHNLWKSEDR